MLAGIKKYVFAACAMVLAITSVVIGYNHVTKAGATSSSTGEIFAESEYNYSINSGSGYSKIYENENFEYLYSSKKTILKIVNRFFIPIPYSLFLVPYLKSFTSTLGYFATSRTK